jgi:hypothetical protein
MSTPDRRHSDRAQEAVVREAGSAASEVEAHRRRQGGGKVRGDFRRWALCASRRQTAGSSATGMNSPSTERVWQVGAGGDRVVVV